MDFRRCLFFLAFSMLAACEGGVENSYEVQSFCVNSDQQKLSVRVDFGAGCLSSSCDDVKSSSCELTLEGNVVSVSGEATVLSGTKRVCTSDCGFLDAQCEIDLPPGDYTLRGGGYEVMVSYPLDMQAGECSF